MYIDFALHLVHQLVNRHKPHSGVHGFSRQFIFHSIEQHENFLHLVFGYAGAIVTHADPHLRLSGLLTAWRDGFFSAAAKNMSALSTRLIMTGIKWSMSTCSSCFPVLSSHCRSRVKPALWNAVSIALRVPSPVAAFRRTFELRSGVS